jgi:hypothetical protein
MSDYLTLADAAQTDPENTDFIALREAYCQSDFYRPTSHYSSGKLMGNTNSLGSFEEVAQFCENILQLNPMDLEVRILLEYAYEKLERHEDALRTRAFVKGMLNAIRTSGDGRTMATAWRVIAVAEEYTILSVMGLRSSQQALLTDNGRYYDCLTCARQGGEEMFDLYFDITTPFSYLQNMLE